MKVLLDTHVLLWMVSRSRQLSSHARELLSDGANELFFSIAGYWELGIKISIGKLELAENWEETLPKEIARNGITWLPVTPPHIHTVARLPWIHRDPFDRLLIAQAKNEKLTIITADAWFADYGVPVVW